MTKYIWEPADMQNTNIEIAETEYGSDLKTKS
jgi:hypothetical protein